MRQTLAPIDEVHVAVVRRLVSHKLDRRARRTSAVLFDDCVPATRSHDTRGVVYDLAERLGEIVVNQGSLTKLHRGMTLATSMICEQADPKRGVPSSGCGTTTRIALSICLENQLVIEAQHNARWGIVFFRLSVN